MIRVAVTTDRFIEAAIAFDRVGLEPVSLPCIRIEAAEDGMLTQARLAASGADLLLISSVRTLEVLWPEGSMPTVEVCAVGELTAAAVQARGGRVVLVGQAGLADLARKTVNRLGSSRVVFPHAADSDQAAMELLSERAVNFRSFAVYRSVPIAPAAGPVQAVAFASPSAVQGWLLSRDFKGLVVGVVGPTTWRAVAFRQVPEVIAPQPSFQALAQALASYLEVAV